MKGESMILGVIYLLIVFPLILTGIIFCLSSNQINLSSGVVSGVLLILTGVVIVLCIEVISLKKEVKIKYG